MEQQKVRRKDVFLLMGILSALFLLVLGGVWWYAWRHGQDLTLSQLEEVIDSTFFPLVSDSVEPENLAALRADIASLFRVAHARTLTEKDWHPILEVAKLLHRTSEDRVVSPEEVSTIRVHIQSALSRLQVRE